MRKKADLLLVIVDTSTIICHGHDERIVVLVVVIKGIKENTQTIPLVIGSKHWTILTFALCVPKSLKIHNTLEMFKIL